MKKLNLIKRLLSYSLEKQSPQRFGRYAAMLIMLLTLGVGQMCASESINHVYMDWYFNDDQFYTINNNQAYHYSSSDDRGNGVLYDLGILTTTFEIYSIYWKVQTSGWNPNYCNGWMKYKINGGDEQSMNYNADINGGGAEQEIGGVFSSRHVVATSSDAPGVYYFVHWFEAYFGWEDGKGYNTATMSNSGKNYKFQYTIPGFSTTSTSQAFTAKVNATSSETISFGGHYGTALTTDNCEITGTNASEFSVTSISESGVTVQFSPTSAGLNKEATLTITDAHSKTCVISLTGKTLVTITYDGNGKEGGSAPSAQDVLYNTATATYTNTGSMTKTNYGFTGWNDKADGTGYHYDAGANITLTADKTLYADWKPCWVLRGGDTNGTSDATQDAMGNWGTPVEMEIIGTNAFMLELDLNANTSYYFKICDIHNATYSDYSTYKHYGCNGTMTTTTLDWAFYDNHGNCQLNTGASGAGTWRFVWNASNKYMCVYAPSDAPKSSFVSGQYVYFDARTESDWQDKDFKAKFYFKNLATGENDGDITCSNGDKLDGWVYYALIPAGKTWGSVQMNRLNPSDDSFWNNASIIYARDRSSANLNCMVTPSSGWDNITLSWDTYCPPMSSATLSDNSTNKILWQSAGNDGSESSKAIWVSTSKTIEVKGVATKAVDDANMTINYDFKVGGSSAQAGSTSTYSKGSLSNGTTYTITMDAYNTYNGATGTKLTASQTLYYKALNTYSITPSMTNMSISEGRTGDDAVANSIDYTATLSAAVGYLLPASITVKQGETTLTGGGTDYTYNSATGALTINGASITGNITITGSGIAKTYSADNNLDKNGGDSHGKYTATFDQTTIVRNTVPSYSGHTVFGYYGENTMTTYIADASGNLQASKSVGGNQVTDGDGKWKRDANIPLYTKWKCDAPSISCTDNVVTITVPKDATVRYTTDGSAPTSSTGTIYAGTFTIDADKTIKAIAYQSGCADSEVASEDVEYTASYTVSITPNHVTKTSGATSILHGKSYMAEFSAVNGYSLPGSSEASDYITVTIGESVLNEGWSWAVAAGTGALTILAAQVTGNISIVVNGVANTYSITLEAGDHGADDGSGSVVFDATSATISTGVSADAGYTLEGYYDGSTKVLNNDGTFAATNVAGYITSGKWSNYDEDATLTAKFSPETLMFNPASGSDWNTASNWSPACVPTIEHDVTIPSGKTATITAAAYARNLTVKSGATLNINTTNGDGTGSGVTLTVNSLSLEGGWTRIDDEDVYDMPRVYIDSKSTLTKTTNIVNFDVAVDGHNYYPIAVPFPVTVGNIDYADAYYASLSTYGLAGQYVIKKYDGATRAESGAVSTCWKVVNEEATLQPGIGYVMTALPTIYDPYAVIRFPMTVDDAWTAGGEKGSATISASTVTKNQVTVTAHVKAEGETPNANKGWNLLGVPYMACFATDDDMHSETDGFIKGRFNYSTNKWEDGEIIYVTVPTHDFSEYHQYDITDGDTKLLPGWCFFIQADKDGTLTFAAEDQTNSGLVYAPKREQASMPTVKTGIILSGADASDKTTFLVSDKYDGSEYEINADLEKMFGENSYTLATYSLMGNSRLAYNAMSNADALNVIPIGYRAPEDGDYTFSINPRYAENFAQVNLIDYQTNTITDLLVDNYTFSSERTQDDARFALNVVPKAEIPTDFDNGALINDENGVRKVLINNQMYIIRGQEMFDATGKRVKEIR